MNDEADEDTMLSPAINAEDALRLLATVVEDPVDEALASLP
jgi:hypothetical protein